MRLFVSNCLCNVRCNWLRFYKKWTLCPRRSAIQETMSSPRTVSWQLLRLQPYSSSLPTKGDSIHLWELGGRLKENKRNYGSLICAQIMTHFTMQVSWTVVLVLLSNRALLHCIMLDWETFFFFLQSRRNLSFCIFSLWHFIFLRRCVDPLTKMAVFKMVFHVVSDGLQIEISNRSISVTECGGLSQMSNGWISWGDEGAGCKWLPALFLLTVVFVIFGVG